MPELDAALDRLAAILKEFGSVLVAFSGGVDSTFLLDVAYQTLKDRVVAATAVDILYPTFEREAAIAFCRERGIRHLVVEVDHLAGAEFAANSTARCYYCKQNLFAHLAAKARKLGIAAVIEGTNADDIRDFRPGIKALSEIGIRSPLREAGFTKRMIRELTRQRGLPAWDRMSCACYGSRFPYDTPITVAAIRQVAMVEEALRNASFTVYRARHLGDTVRLELNPEEMVRLMEPGLRDMIVNVARQAGYRHVVLDLAGYRTGSLNEQLDDETREKWREK